MASPLHWFRKRQKLLLGVFGVALIFVFTISLGTGTDPLVDLIAGNRSSSSGGPNAIAVSWQGGKLREGDLQNLRTQRTLVRQYLAVIRQTAIEDGGRPQEDLFSQDLSDAALLELQLLQEHAAEMGLSVTDEDIKDYLVGLTDDRLQEYQLNEIWENLTGGNYSDVQLFGMLRRELAAHRVREFMVSSGFTISPIQIWDQFNRLERRVHVEMMPIEVDSFLDKVSDPDETELREFFERHKEDVAYPMSPTPGFFQLERRAFEFIKFDFNAFLESEAQRISAAAVKEYYESNKSDFIDTKLPASDLELPDDTADAMSEQDAIAPAEIAAESDLEESEPVPPAPPKPPEETTSDRVEAGAEYDQATGEMDAAAAEEPRPADESVDDDAAVPDAASQETTSTNTDEPAENEAIPEEQDASDSEIPQATASPLPQDQAATEEALADGGTGDAAGPASAETQDVLSGDTSNPAGRYRSLEDVEDEIRRILAMPLARQRMDQAMAKARQRLIPYLQWHRSNAGETKDAAPAPEVDLESISSDPPLSIETVPLSNESEIGSYEVGQSFDISTRDEQLVTIPFAQMAFRRDFQPYQPAAIPSSSGNWPQYLFWVTTVEPAYVPSLEEVRDEVVLAWKREKAFDLAVEDASDVVEKARDNPGKPLQEVCPEPGRKFFDEPNVRWLSTGNVPATAGMTPRATQIPSVPGTTEEMLRTIFRMKPGDIEMVSNADKSQVYVVRHVTEAPTEDVRRNIFLRGTGVQEEIQGALQREFLTEWQLAYLEMLREAQVDWKRGARE